MSSLVKLCCTFVKQKMVIEPLKIYNVRTRFWRRGGAQRKGSSWEFQNGSRGNMLSPHPDRDWLIYSEARPSARLERKLWRRPARPISLSIVTPYPRQDVYCSCNTRLPKAVGKNNIRSHTSEPCDAGSKSANRPARRWNGNVGGRADQKKSWPVQINGQVL